MASIREYKISESVTFAKTTAKFGGFSNMASGYSLFVNEINIPSSEALYQACKFPLYPEIQEKIIKASNAMVAKRIAVANEHYVRQDWDKIKFDVMRWCLRIKFLQNRRRMEELFSETSEKPIVEYSKKDSIWGAMPEGNNILKGINAMGRLLMELRKQAREGTFSSSVMPPNIIGFLLYGHPIEEVHNSEYYLEENNDEEELK